MEYEFFKKNIISSNEACELLGISRQRLFNLVKTKELRPLIHEKAFSLFLRKDIMALKYLTPFNTSAPIIDNSLSTTRTVEFFHNNIDQLGKIESIFIFEHQIDAAINGFFIPYDYVGNEELQFVRSPHFIIRDINGKELWLLNYNCEYINECSKKILKQLIRDNLININSRDVEIDDTISNKQIIHFHFESDFQLVAKDSMYNFNDKNIVLCRKDKLVLIDNNKYQNKKVDDILDKYSSFLLIPKKIIYYPTEKSAEDSGMKIRLNSFEYYSSNCKIINQFGNELWIYLPNHDKSFLSKNSKFHELLDYYEINLPKSKINVFKESCKAALVSRNSCNNDKSIILDI